jgi:16S rRNA (cytosine1402-N4)-methyltransferase
VSFEHATVLEEAVISFLTPRGECTYVDATLGGGGHGEAILEANDGARLVALDRDETAIFAAKQRLARFGDRVRIVKAKFGDARAVLPPLLPDGRCDGLVADLGVSSPQLDDASRGMSFRREASDAPIDMRMDRSSGETAREKIDAWSEEELANVIFELGEERRSRKIARSIKRAADEGKLETTGDLRHAIWSAVGGRGERGIDPATRTFQALRIAVNDELGELDRLLDALPDLLRDGGVACVISFHSLEDRRVKHAFAKDGWERLHKKPIVADEREIAVNPRSRSAKLRAARRFTPTSGAEGVRVVSVGREATRGES